MAKSKGNRPYHLTPSESAVMQILWNSKEPMTQLGIIDAAKINETLTWKERSIFSMLNALLEKGMIKEEGMVRSGKTYARTFVAAMTKAEYYAQWFPMLSLRRKWLSSVALCAHWLRTSLKLSD